MRDTQVNPIIRQIVDRRHVGESNRTVIRYLVSRIKGGYRGWRKIDRFQRRHMMAQAVVIHEQNRRFYHAVMAGKGTP